MAVDSNPIAGVRVWDCLAFANGRRIAAARWWSIPPPDAARELRCAFPCRKQEFPR